MQGGVADYTRALARELSALGQQVAVLTAVQAQPILVEAGIEVYPVIRRWGWQSWPALDALIRNWQPHIVHIQYQTAAYGMHPAINLWPWRPWRRPPVHTAVTFHDLRLPYLFPKAHAVRRWVTHTLARSVDLVIATNPKDSAELRALRPDVQEIPIGSNIPDRLPPAFERAAWRRRWGIADDVPLLCYFGFLNASKGGEMLIEVLARLVRRGLDAHLLMIGGRVGASDATNAAYLQKVEALIEERAMAARVHWTDHIPDEQVAAAFHCADVCLLPYQDGVSYRRGSFMAALAHGMAIVTTPPRVPYEDLEAGETVLLAPAEDVAAMTEATMRVLRQRALRQRLQSNARRLAQRFRWQAIARAHLAAYASLTS